MTFATVLLLLTVGIVGGILLFTKIGKRIRLRATGTINEKLSEDASTPEGAKAYFNAAIEKKEEDYSKASANYSQILGKLSAFEKDLRTLQKDEMKVNMDIDSCVSRGDDEGAKTYLKIQQEIADKMEVLKDSIKDLKENERLQKETVDKLYDDLAQLKAEKEKTVFTLETVEATKSLKADTTVSSNEEDKMLEKVRDGVRKAREESEGNRIAYENSASVQKKRLDKKMKDEEINKKLAELKAKKGMK